MSSDLRNFFGSPLNKKRASTVSSPGDDSSDLGTKRNVREVSSSPSSSTSAATSFGSDHAETLQIRREMDLKVHNMTVAESKTAEGKALIISLSNHGDPGWINKDLNILRTRAFKSVSSKVCVVRRMPPEKKSVTWTFVVQDDARPTDSPICICDLCFIEVYIS